MAAGHCTCSLCAFIAALSGSCKRGATKEAHIPTDSQRRPAKTLAAAIAVIAATLSTPAVPPASAQAEPAATTAGQSGQSAVVFVYHRFGEGRYPSTNIRLEQFEEQIAELTAGGHTALPLARIVEAVRSGTPLPDRTVSITVDDAYASVIHEGWPRLKAAGIPLTVFVSTDSVDAGYDGYMTWDQIRALARDGVPIGHHTASHLHMIAAGVDASLADIRRASARFQAELGYVPPLFAYPYGEFSLELAQAVREEGFDGAVAQYSSVARVGDDAFTLPRFPVNERYGEMGRFRLIANARALPISDLTPRGPVLKADDNPPVFGFTVAESVAGLSALACYPSHLGAAAPVEVLGTHRVEVRFDKPFPAGRSRINCTMPGPDRRWYWFGRPFFVLE